MHRRLFLQQSLSAALLAGVTPGLGLAADEAAGAGHVSLPVIVKISDVTLTVISKKTGRVLDLPGEINLGGAGKLVESLKPGVPPHPLGPGFNLTEYPGHSVHAELTVDIENHAKSPLTVSAQFIFGVPTSAGWRHLKRAENRYVTINPGKIVNQFPEASLTIQASGAPRDGKYSVYPVLSVMAYDPDGVLTRPTDWTSFVVVSQPWYFSEQGIVK
jgi:hypothetical protein